MVDIRPQDLNPAVTPIDADSPIIIDQGLAGVNRTTSTEMVNSVAPVASKDDAEVGTNDVKRMTALKTKQSIASEVGVSVASYAAGQAGLSAVQSVNGKTGNAVTLDNGDVGLGNVDNTSDVDKPISAATQTALNLKADADTQVIAGSGLTGGGALSGDVTLELTTANVDRLDKVDGIEAGATKNETDAHLLARANHTGTQAISTVSGLQGALDGKLPVDGVAEDSDKLGGETAQEWADKINVGGIYDTKAAAQAANIPSSVNAIRLNGGASLGDGNGGLYSTVNNGSTDVVVSSGRTFYRVKDVGLDRIESNFVASINVNVLSYGADRTGVLGSSSAIQLALEFVSSAGGGVCIIPAGDYLIDAEIKIPPFVHLKGEGVGVTRLKAAASLHVNQNVITNAGNNRLPRSALDEYITVSDMSIDGNAWERDPTASVSTENQGSGVKFSSVRHGSMINVRAVNCPLHCLDIMASTYLNDGNTNSQPVGASLDCIMINCTGVDPQRDDPITTHNSGRIHISNCTAVFTKSADQQLYSQQGIEIDEGCWDVTVVDCRSYNAVKGFQAKGHPTTKSASFVKFIRCTAFNCGMGFDIAHSSVILPNKPNCYNIDVTDCIVDGLVKHGDYDARWVNIDSAADVRVINLTIRNPGDGVVWLVDRSSDTLTSKNTVIDGLRIYGYCELIAGQDTPSMVIGIVHCTSSLANGRTTVRNIWSDTPQRRPVVVNNNGDHAVLVENINVTGAQSPYGAVKINTFDVAEQSITGVRSTGYSGAIQDPDNVYGNSIEVRQGNRKSMSIRSGTPEGIVYAPQGTILTAQFSGRMFRKDATGGQMNTGWKEFN